jgi:hypothetical protein
MIKINEPSEVIIENKKETTTKTPFNEEIKELKTHLLGNIKLNKFCINNNFKSHLYVDIQLKLDKLFEMMKQLIQQDSNTDLIQSKPPSFDVNKYVLLTNIKINNLLNQGFEIIYNESYNEHETTNDELYNINKSLCIRKESIICVGGLNSVTNIFTLVSCGSCWQVLTTTSLNQPRLVNGAWWYFTPNRSFGFAPIYNIKQYFYDCYDCVNCNDYTILCSDSNRLSWKLTGDSGSRLGKNLSSNISLAYRKIIILLR